LPTNLEEYHLGYQLLERWAQENTSKKSVLFAEHGVGKLKKSFFLKYTPVTYIEEIQRYKDQLDPHHLLNPGNVLGE
jgi:D-lactate dehydrogenase (cytochrome)